MASPGLPVNVDTTYSDNATDPSVKVHQGHHDTIHTIVNREDVSAPGVDGAVRVWSNANGYYSARLLTNLDAKAAISKNTTVSGAWTVNASTSTAKDYTLTGATTFSFTGWPAGGASGYVGEMLMYVRQDGTGSRGVTWPAAVQWPGGVDPTPSTAPGSLDVYYFLTVDGGTTVQGVQLKGFG